MLTSLAGLWVGFGVAAGLLLCLIVYRAAIGITEDFPLFLVTKMLDMLFRQRATGKPRGSKGLIIFAALAVVSPASAAAIAARGAVTRVDSGSTNVCLQDLNSFTPNSGVAASCIGNILGGDYNIFATGSAAFGRLGVLISVDNHHFSSNASYDADGFASFSDTLTMSAGSQAVFTFGISGGAGAVRFGKIGGVEQRIFAPGQSVSFTYNFTPGSPFDIGFALDADSIDTPLSLSNCTPDGFCDDHQLDDFADTASLTSVQVLDGQGHPLPGVSIISDSGFDYSTLGGVPRPVPEPSTGLLFAMGALLSTLRRFVKAS